MDILINEVNEVAAQAESIQRIPQGWLVGESVYPGYLTHLSADIPPELAGKRLSYIDGVFAELPPLVDPEAEARRAQAIRAEIVQATQARLDAFARTRNYDDIKSASDYAGCSVPKFASEGTYCRDARAETWAKLYEMLAEVEAGTRPMPAGFADVEAELPALVWPQ